MLKLIDPSYKYSKSFARAVQEYLKAGEMTKTETNQILKEIKDPNVFVRRKKIIKKERLKKGHIPRDHYWLVDGKEYLGQLDIRHKLNKAWRQYGGHIGFDIRPSKRGKGYGNQMQKLALSKIKKLGIHNILVTCNKDNVRSIKIIKAYGGKLIDEVKKKGQKIPVLRFRILN